MRFREYRFDLSAPNGIGGHSPAPPIAAVPFLLAAQGAVDSEDFNDLLFWGGLLIVSMLVLFVVQKVIRFGIQSRVRSIHRQFGIRPDDLDEMTRTGLLTDEEKKKIQEAIKRNLLKESQEAVRSQTVGRVSAEQLLKSTVGEKEEGGWGRRPGPGSRLAGTQPRVPVREGAPRGEEATPSEAAAGGPAEGMAPDAPAESDDQAAVDLEALLHKGLITPEEFEELRRGRETEI